eukprot:scaffold43901_cov52-Attheya_sp.AAC.2
MAKREENKPMEEYDEEEVPFDEREEEANAAPLHLHSLRGIDHAVLQGIQHPSRSRQSSRSSSRSRRRSRSHSSGGSMSPRGGSETVSLPDIDDDQDILLDKYGFQELEPPPPGPHHVHAMSSLAPVTERLSEETLDDVHAFADLECTHDNKAARSYGTTLSDSNSRMDIEGNNSIVMETLDEEESSCSSDSDRDTSGYQEREVPKSSSASKNVTVDPKKLAKRLKQIQMEEDKNKKRTELPPDQQSKDMVGVKENVKESPIPSLARRGGI